MIHRGGAARLWRRHNRKQLQHHHNGGSSTTQSPPTHNIHHHHYFSTDAGGGGGGDVEKDRRRGGGPPPIRVSMTESAGRGVFATRQIRAGELVHTAKPLFTHPSPSLTSPVVCYYCLRRLRLEGDGCTVDDDLLESSSTGGNYRFCSTSCLENSKGFLEVDKRANWSEYDDYCKAQKLKYPLLVKRMACMVISGTASYEAIDILQPAVLPAGAISQMELEFQLLKSTLLKAQIRDESIRFLTKNWYVGALARIRVNAFRIELVGGRYEDLLANAMASVGADASVGNAIYMLPSFYNHDCGPGVEQPESAAAEDAGPNRAQ